MLEALRIAELCVYALLGGVATGTGCLYVYVGVMLVTRL